jgi:hypothetical protein
MAITKIYIESNFVAIDNGSEVINYIPNGNSDFEYLGDGNYCAFKSGGQFIKNYSFNYLDVRTKAGAAIGGGTEAEVVLYLTTVFNTAAGGSAASGFNYTATNYTDLITNIAPTATDGNIAIVYNSQGVWLINRKLKGIYIYQSSSWQYANQELQDILQAKIDSVTGDGVNNSDLLNPVLTFPTPSEIGAKPNFTENTAFNKNFGTSASEVLEGDTRTITPSEITTIGNQTNTNTGDETTASIQSKRPLKTVNSQTLEGAGNITISGTVEPLPICVLSSTNSGLTATQSTPAIFPWDVETEKDTGFTHSNSTNNTRLTVVADGTYQIQANIRMFSSQQRAQFVGRYLIDGVIQSMPLGSSYIRNNGTSSDFWTCIINPPPVKLTAGQYIEIQIQIEAQGTTTITGQFRGSDSTFSMVKLQGVKGETGTTGSGSNIIVQKDDVTVGTNTDTLNFEGNITSSDDGGGKTTLTIGGGQTWYKQKVVNTIGGTVNAAFGSPVECVPSSGTFEITVVESGDYVIYGAINIGTNLNADNNAIELIYGIDTGSGASAGAQPFRQAQNAKKNRRNGIQGTFGNISLTAGDKVHLFLSTLGDSTTWESGEIFIQTWK